MPQINDQVLASIALDLGRDEQIPGADLQDIIVPVVGLERYRRRVTFFQSVIPVDATNSAVKITYEARDDVSRNLFLGEVVNGDVNAILVVGQVRLTELPSFLIEPLNVRSAPGAGDVVIGPQAIVGTTSPGRENYHPTNIWIPRDAEFILTIDPSGANFGGVANLQVRLWMEDAPPEQTLVGGAPSETIVV